VKIEAKYVCPESREENLWNPVIETGMEMRPKG